MAEPPNDPTNRELLERIAALEAQNAKLAEGLASLERRADNNHDAHMKFIDKLGSIEEHLIELMEKVFPGWARTQVQIIDLFKAKDKAE